MHVSRQAPRSADRRVPRILAPRPGRAPRPCDNRPMATEIYVSTDIEADGPIPGPHSMLSFASAAFLADKTCVSTFSANLGLLPGAAGHPDTMAFWRSHPQAWESARRDLREPAEAMTAYVQWID